MSLKMQIKASQLLDAIELCRSTKRQWQGGKSHFAAMPAGSLRLWAELITHTLSWLTVHDNKKTVDVMHPNIVLRERPVLNGRYKIFGFIDYALPPVPLWNQKYSRQCCQLLHFWNKMILINSNRGTAKALVCDSKHTIFGPITMSGDVRSFVCSLILEKWWDCPNFKLLCFRFRACYL